MKYIIVSRKFGDTGSFKTVNEFTSHSDAVISKIKLEDEYESNVQKRESYANNYVNTCGLDSLGRYLDNPDYYSRSDEQRKRRDVIRNLLHDYNDSPKDFLPPEPIDKVEYQIVEYPDE